MEASALRAPAGLTRLALPSALLRLRSDEQLVGLFRAGNEDAFGVIHDRYRPRLLAYTRQMLGGSGSDAEDALQDVFLRAYNALRVDERPVALKAWLYRVAHNRCIDHLRRPTPPPADVFDLSRTPTPDPTAEAERRDDLRRLVADVRRLPEQQRSALLMRELEGLSYADLAAALDVSVPAIKSLLVRARIGLVEAAEARDTACAEIRDDLALSFGKGVRASALARRHMRECDGCRGYRSQLRTVSHGLSSLAPSGHPLGMLAKLLGLGGAGSGAAAGGGGGAAAAGGAAAGGGVAAASGGVVTAKVAALVCSAALTAAGGAVELSKSADAGGPAKKAHAAATTAPTTRDSEPATRPVQPDRMSTAVASRRAAGASAVRARALRAAKADRAARLAAAAAAAPTADGEAISTHVTTGDGGADRPKTDFTGGAMAPAEEDPTRPTDGSDTAAAGDASDEPTAIPAVAGDPPPAPPAPSAADGQPASGAGSATTSGDSDGGGSAGSPDPSSPRR